MFAQSTTKFIRSAALCGVLGTAFALSGCAAGDVEMNGAIFDYLGMGKAGPEKVSQAPERQGLVLPPSLDRLPPPGSGATGAAATQAAFPVNPETKVNVAAAQQASEQAKFCEKALVRAKLTKDLGNIPGPYGSCNASALTSLNGSNPLADAGGTHQVSIPKRN
jgi:hypothetical protein